MQLFSIEGYNELNGVKASMNDVGITVLLAVIGVIITAILVVKKCKGKYFMGNSDHMDPLESFVRSVVSMFQMQNSECLVCYRISAKESVCRVLHRIFGKLSFFRN